MSTDNFRKSRNFNIFLWSTWASRCHYTTRPAEVYAKYQGDERASRIANLKKCLLKQQDFSKKATKENNTAVEASYVVSEMIAKAG